MQNDVISVVVPVYNAEDYLEQALNSIIYQTYTDLDIILVDDGSTDGSGGICDKYAVSDTRIRVIHKENGGQSSARNIGISIAKGKYVGFVDSDDSIALDMFETLYRICGEMNCEISCIRFSTMADEKVNTDQKEIRQDKVPCVFTDKEVYSKILFPEQNVYITQSVCGRLFERELIKDLQFPEQEVYEEVMFNTKALYNTGKMAYLDEALYYYRIREGSTTHKKEFDIKLFSDRIPHLREQVRFFDKVGYKDMAILHKAVYYTELLYLSSRNPYRQYDEEVKKVLGEWRLGWSEIVGVPVSSFRKFLLYIRMRAPGIVRQYYRTAK